MLVRTEAALAAALLAARRAVAGPGLEDVDDGEDGPAPSPNSTSKRTMLSVGG